MTERATVSINGQEYDAVTGLPLETSTTQSAKPASEPTSRLKVSDPHHAAAMLHNSPQRSVTLRRKSLKKPTPAKHAIVKRSSSVKHMDIARPHKNVNVHKFAPHPAGALKPKSVDVGPVTHPHVAKAHALSAAKAQPLTKTITASEVKDQAVKTAVANTHKRAPLKSRLKPRQRTLAVLSATLAIVLLGGYFTYLNMPALSVRIAAVQAGIDANYPSYRPDGYALNGPVNYSNGRVAMNFKANGGNQDFTISQSKSGWDSTALLDNYVTPKAGSNYVPYTERGLTIYTYGDNAAWVNGGILYTIEGNAPLSSSQIRKIATSLL